MTGPCPGHLLAPLSRAGLRFPGHLPLPGERVAVLQDLVRDPVHRRSLTPPGPPSPVGGPAGRVTPRMEGHELATPEETGVSGLAPDPPAGRRGKDSSSGFQAGPASLCSLTHFIREYSSLSGKEKQPPGKSDLFLQL